MRAQGPCARQRRADPEPGRIATLADPPEPLPQAGFVILALASRWSTW